MKRSSPTGSRSAALAALETRAAKFMGGRADVEAATDAATQDRVHAWYKAQQPHAAPVRVAAMPSLKASANRAEGAPALSSQDMRAVATVSPPRRNNADDAGKPLAQSSTDADDTADAESRIPSTAPTEREPLPFAHGTLTTGAPVAAVNDPADDHVRVPAVPAAALRQPQPAVNSLQSAAKRRELDPAVASAMAERALDEDDAPAKSAAVMPAISLFDHGGHLIAVPPMKGSREILIHQNTMAAADGLSRIQDDGDLLALRRQKLLAALPDQESVYPDDRLPANRRYARPWTVKFLRDLARAHYARFGTPLIVTSAARTVAFQKRLVRTNGNAAPPMGEIASPHLYGQAVDIGKRGMGLTELTWMRAYLTPVENDGKIDVEEEFQQSCFHISVYRRYSGLPAPAAKPTQAPPQLLLAAKPAVPEAAKPEKKRRRISTAMLATGLR